MHSSRSSSTRRSKIPGVSILRSVSTNRNDNKHSTGTQPRLSRISSIKPGSSKNSKYGNKETVRDPRQISDKGFKDSVIKESIEFLHKNGYPHQVSFKVLQSPSNSDFRNIVNFMIRMLPIGNNFQLGQDLPESFPDLMRILSYQYPIPKNILKTVGVPHQWPQLLLCLDYIRTLIQTTNAGQIDVYNYLDKDKQKLYDCIQESYRNFLVQDDEQQSFEDQFLQNFISNPELASHNRVTEGECVRMESETGMMKLKGGDKDAMVEEKERDVVKIGDQVENLKTHSLKMEEDIEMRRGQLILLSQKCKEDASKQEELLIALNARQKIISSQESLGFDVYQTVEERKSYERQNCEEEVKNEKYREDLSLMKAAVAEKYKKTRELVDEMKRKVLKLGLDPCQEQAIFDLELNPNNMTKFMHESSILKDLLNGWNSMVKANKTHFESKIEARDVQLGRVEDDLLSTHDETISVEKQIHNGEMLKRQFEKKHQAEMGELRGEVDEADAGWKMWENQVACAEHGKERAAHELKSKDDQAEALDIGTLRLAKGTRDIMRRHFKDLMAQRKRKEDVYKMCMRETIKEVEQLFERHPEEEE